MRTSDWTIAYDKSETTKPSRWQEAQMSLGNGYLVWNALPIWSLPSADHFPCLYTVDVSSSDTAERQKTGQFSLSETLVNLPNPQFMRFFVNDRPVSFDSESVVDCKSHIDLEHGFQSDKCTVRVAEGFVSLSTTKYMDPYNFHAIGFEGSFSATFDGNLLVESFIDASDSQVLEAIQISDRLLSAKNSVSGVEIAVAAKTFVNGNLMEQIESNSETQLLERALIQFKSGESVKFDKVIEIASSFETENPAEVVRQDVNSLPLASIKSNNAKYWAEVWAEADFRLESDDSETQRKIRQCVFRLHQAAQHSAYLSALGSDEVNKVLPYYISNAPDLARNLLIRQISQRDDEIATNYNLWLYEQYTKDQSLLNESGLEFLLESLKSSIEQDETKDNHQGKMLDSLLKWLFTIPAAAQGRDLDLLSAAKKSRFDNKVFQKAKKLTEKFEFSSSQEDSEQTLQALLADIDNDSDDEEDKMSLGKMATILSIIKDEFARVGLSDNKITIAPNLPPSWHKLVFYQKFQGAKLKIEVSERLLILTADEDMTVIVYGAKAELKAGVLSTFALKNIK